MALITLRVLDGADRGRVFDDMPTPITIGREEGNTIQLNDERVSRFHLKIQEDRDKVVLTDLESTNGTKVNGEDIQLRILRFGDMIALGRSVLLFGKREQIAERLANIKRDANGSGTIGREESLLLGKSGGSEFDLDLDKNADLHNTLYALAPPELPQRLSPAQAAQLSEMIEYLHIRIRELLASVKMKSPADRVTLELEQWQNVLDLQSHLADYLREIGEPQEE
ncbi:MAG TPA: FHA domain-containing protein [Pirellulales bacterium]|jgi:pSer/pThr/pTyr-binding forkhead associated (FHA) protein|nr:FHA domain-containing protein [Pirellulales bacterium]